MAITKLNIIFLGEMGVGKSSILRRYASRDFREHMNPTVVADCRDVNMTLNGETIKLIIWDTAGQERFKAIVRSYYRMADGVLLVYDVTDYSTFSMVSGWLSDLRKLNNVADVLIVGNKNEDPDRKAVASSAVNSFAQQEGMDYLECSAKSGENIDQVFETLVLKIMKRKDPTSFAVPSSAKTKASTTKQAIKNSESFNNGGLPAIIPLDDEDFQLHVQPVRNKKWYKRMCTL